MGGSGGSSEDQNAYRNADSEGQAHEISFRKRSLLGIRLEAICVTYGREFLTFFPCPKTPNET
jgi:hypothetical protein